METKQMTVLQTFLFEREFYVVSMEAALESGDYESEQENVGKRFVLISCHGTNPMVARYQYLVVVLVITLLSWMARDFAQTTFQHLPDMKGCKGDKQCLGSEGVLRVCFGGFIFFLIMYITTVGVSSIDDPRDSWHTGFWPVKTLVLVSCILVPFYLPASVSKFYGEISRFGAGVFLFIQFLAILNLALWLSDGFCSDKKSPVFMLVLAFICFATSVVGLVMMYIYFAPQVSCEINIFLITWTLVEMLVTTCIALHPKINLAPISSGLLSLYFIFLCWFSLSSEPGSDLCNLQSITKADSWVTVMSFVLGAFTLAMATLSAKIDPNSFSAAIREKKSEKHIPYSYGFFHFTLCLASMYLAMLLLSWNTQQTAAKWTLDFGWASVWVKMVNQWLAAGLYAWTMLRQFISTSSE